MNLISSTTEDLLGFAGFAVEWVEAMGADLRGFAADDPQIVADLVRLIKRSSAGTCRRKIPGQTVDVDGDWDAPMWGSNLDIGELRLPISDVNRLYRIYLTAHPNEFNTILLLHAAWKPGGGGDEARVVQDEHVREAERRFVAWRRAKLL